MKMMLLKIEVGLLKIMLSWNSSYIWRLSCAKDFARTSACAKIFRRANILLRYYSAAHLAWAGWPLRWDLEGKLYEFQL